MSQKTRDDTRPPEPQMRAEPKPRFPEQHQRSPGLEAASNRVHATRRAATGPPAS